MLTDVALRAVEVLRCCPFLKQEELRRVCTDFSALLPEVVQLVASIPRHRPSLDGVLAKSIELFQILLYVIEGARTLRRDNPLKLHISLSLRLLIEELQDVEVGVTQVSLILIQLSRFATCLSACGQSTGSSSHGFNARSCRARCAHIGSVSLLIKFFLGLLDLLLYLSGLFAICIGLHD